MRSQLLPVAPVECCYETVLLPWGIRPCRRRSCQSRLWPLLPSGPVLQSWRRCRCSLACGPCWWGARCWAAWCYKSLRPGGRSCQSWFLLASCLLLGSPVLHSYRARRSLPGCPMLQFLSCRGRQPVVPAGKLPAAR